jgi:hypothetical protein
MESKVILIANKKNFLNMCVPRLQSILLSLTLLEVTVVVVVVVVTISIVVVVLVIVV